jgi:replicative DNA helicase
MKIDNTGIPPQSIEAERTILGAIIHSTPSAALAIETIEEESFYTTAHKIIFRSIKELFLKKIPIDMVSISEHLKSKVEFEVIGAESYLAELMESVCTFKNLPYYCEILLDKAERRKNIESLTTIINSYMNDQDSSASDISSKAISMILSNQKKGRKNKTKKFSELLPGEFDRIEKISKGGQAADIETGYKSLDNTVFIQNGDNIIIGGYPSMGKTSVTDCIVRNIASQGKRILKINLESSNENECRRSLFSAARLNMNLLYSGIMPKRDFPKLSLAAGPLSEYEIYMNDDPFITPSKIYSLIYRLQHEVGKVDLLVVDFLQLMKSDIKYENRRVKVGELSRDIKNIGQEFKMPTIVLSQLSRPEKGVPKEPTLFDLRESGDIEQNADVVILLHREEIFYNNEIAKERGIDNKIKVIIAKNKNGPTGYKDMVYLKEYMKLEELIEYGGQEEFWQDRSFD